MLLYAISFFFHFFSAQAGPCEDRCSCVLPLDQPLSVAVPQALAYAEAVFSGSVISVEAPDYAAVLAGTARGEFRVLLKVERSWNGPTADTLSVYTFGHTEMCGIEFVPGARYLVYAQWDAQGTMRRPHAVALLR
jgi:hypothetical protein